MSARVFWVCVFSSWVNGSGGFPSGSFSSFDFAQSQGTRPFVSRVRCRGAVSPGHFEWRHGCVAHLIRCRRSLLDPIPHAFVELQSEQRISYSDRVGGYLQSRSPSLAGQRRPELTYLRICSDLEPALTQVTLATKVPNGRRVVHADFTLLCVVPDTLTDVIVATIAPDVVRQLEPDNQDSLVQFACSVT